MDPYIGEIRMFAGNFAPADWALCDGSLLPISQYDALFSLIGTTYGGDGQTTFALPNLLGRVPVHQTTGFALGQTAGSEEVTLTQAQLPSHSHIPQAARTNQGVNAPGGKVWAASPTYSEYGPTPDSSMGAQALASTGGGQPHDNMVPFLAVNFIMALFGIYPSQN